jgi:putative flippase GtrA
MLPVLQALRYSMCDLMRPRVLLWVIAPITCALIVWGVTAWLWWGPLTAAIAELLPAWFPGEWLGSWQPGVRGFFAALLTLGMLGPLVMITAVTVTAFFVMPVLVDVVSASRFPTLERMRFGTVAGSVWNTVIALVIYVVLWVVTLPLWLTGIGAIVVPMLNSALLNQRVFRYDALSEHASAREYAALAKNARQRLFTLALLLSPLSVIPLANLFGPVISGLAFTHLCLAELESLRKPAIAAS